LSFVNFQGKLTGTSCDLFACEASFSGLLCAWREVQILRQHTFWHAQWDHSRKSRPLSGTAATAAGCCGSVPTEVFAVIQKEQEWRPIPKK
jgi:hypothetical protein